MMHVPANAVTVRCRETIYENKTNLHSSIWESVMIKGGANRMTQS
jgi:hypothetical protein